MLIGHCVNEFLVSLGLSISKMLCELRTTSNCSHSIINYQHCQAGLNLADSRTVSKEPSRLYALYLEHCTGSFIKRQLVGVRPAAVHVTPKLVTQNHLFEIAGLSLCHFSLYGLAGI